MTDRHARCHTPVPQFATLEQLEPRKLLSSTATITVNPGVTHQKIDGWGASMVGWLEHVPAYNDPNMFNTIVNDLGVNILRVPIWPEFASQPGSPPVGGFDWSTFDSSAMAPTMKFAQELKKRVPDGQFKVIGSVWSPPWWMKTNAAYDFGGSLREDMRGEFAKFLSTYAQAAKRDYGIDFHVISLQNEPYFIEPYESTIYTPEQMRETLKVVDAQFKADSLSTKLMVHEDLVWKNRWRWWEDAIRNDPVASESNYMWGAHWADGSFYPQMQKTVRETGRKLWITEAGGKQSNWFGGLRLAHEMIGNLARADASAFLHWQFDGDGTASFFSNGQPTAHYQAMKHVTAFARPGAFRIDTQVNGPQFDFGAVAFVNKGADNGRDTHAVVLVNNTTEPVEVRVNLDGILGSARTWRHVQSVQGALFQDKSPVNTNGQLVFTMPARSMSTFHDSTRNLVTGGRTSTTARGDVPVLTARDARRFHPIRDAAFGGDINRIRSQANASNIHQTWSNGRDALLMAAAGNRPATNDIIAHLIGLGANVNRADVEGITPLMIAATTPLMRYGLAVEDSVLKSRQLLDAGANLHAKDHQGRTPLHWGAKGARFIFDEFQPYNGEVVNLLLQRGADKNKVDQFGKTALMYARQEGNGGNAAFIASWNTDTVAPELLRASSSGMTATLTFDEGLAALPSGAVRLQRFANGSWQNMAANVTARQLPAGNTAVDVVPTGSWTDGRYRVVASAGQVRDKAGNAMAADAVHEFHALMGDANGDGVVDFRDYRLLRQHYGRSGVGFAGGDFNGDGRVGWQDLILLRQSYGNRITPVSPPPGDPPPGGEPPAPGAGGDEDFNGGNQPADWRPGDDWRPDDVPAKLVSAWPQVDVDGVGGDAGGPTGDGNGSGGDDNGGSSGDGPGTGSGGGTGSDTDPQDPPTPPPGGGSGGGSDPDTGPGGSPGQPGGGDSGSDGGSDDGSDPGTPVTPPPGGRPSPDGSGAPTRPDVAADWPHRSPFNGNGRLDPTWSPSRPFPLAQVALRSTLIGRADVLARAFLRMNADDWARAEGRDVPVRAPEAPPLVAAGTMFGGFGDRPVAGLFPGDGDEDGTDDEGPLTV